MRLSHMLHMLTEKTKTSGKCIPIIPTMIMWAAGLWEHLRLTFVENRTTGQVPHSQWTGPGLLDSQRTGLDMSGFGLPNSAQLGSVSLRFAK